MKFKGSQDALLNLTRAFSAFSIAIWHFQLLIPMGNLNEISIQDYPFPRVLGFLYTHGFLAVQLFWVISGFVISKAYMTKTWKPRSFLQNRFARLYPLHLLTLLIVATLQHAYRNLQGEYAICEFQDTYHFLLNIFFIPAIGLEEGCSYNAPIWSVSVELISYFAFAILLTLGGKITTTKLAIINCLTLILLIFNPVNLPTHILECGFFFFAGVSLYALQSDSMKFPSYAIVFLLFFLLFKSVKIKLGTLEITESSIPWVLFFGTILVLQDWVNKKLPIWKSLRKVSQRLGDLTYSSYLLQYPLILIWLLVCRIFRINLEPSHLPLLLIGYISSLFMLSYFTFQKFESYWREKLRD